MDIHLKIIGVALMLLAFMHIGFPKYFKWKEQIPKLSLMNGQMLYVHAFFIALVVFLIGLLSITQANDLVETKLGKNVSLGLAFFWFLRLVFQLFIYSPNLWKGKLFETSMHILFTCFWIYLTLVFGSIYFLN